MNKLHDFKKLVGKNCDFYGVNAGVIKLDDVCWEPVQKTSSGSHSNTTHYMSEVCAVVEEKPFSKSPMAVVTVNELKGNLVGYELVDADTGDVWLQFGTDRTDPYNEKYFFNYSPWCGFRS